MLGERPSSFKADDLSQIRIEVTEVLGAEFCQLVVPQNRQEAVNVLRSRARVDLANLPGAISRSHSSVYFASVMLRSTSSWGSDLHSRSNRTACSFNHFFPLFWGQTLRWMNGFLLGPDAIALVVIAHRDHQQVAAAPFSDTCPCCVDLSFAGLTPVEADFANTTYRKWGSKAIETFGK